MAFKISAMLFRHTNTLYTDIKQQLHGLKNFSTHIGNTHAIQRVGLYIQFKFVLSLRFVLRKTWETSGLCSYIAA